MATAVLERDAPGISNCGFEPADNSEWSGMIEVKTARGRFKPYLSCKVFIDGHLAGSVSPRSPVRYRMKPGCYTIAARNCGARSGPETFWVKPGEHVVFVYDLEDFSARLWKVLIVLLAALVGHSAVWTAIKWALPSFLPRWTWISAIWSLPCLAALGLGEFILFSRMLPWSPPDRCYRLSRLSSQTEP